jgi:hypothetical protein
LVGEAARLIRFDAEGRVLVAADRRDALLAGLDLRQRRCNPLPHFTLDQTAFPALCDLSIIFMQSG